MAKREDMDLLVRWLERPLCCKYAAVVLRPAPVRTSGSEIGPDRTVFWGIGILADGESEILGAWMQAGSSSIVPREVFADLKLRGVHSFRVLAGCAAAEEASSMFRDVGARVPGGQVMPFQGRVLAESASLLSLRPATRRAALCADELVEGIQRRLASAVSRHGAFADDDEGKSFIAALLVRADRRLYEPPAVRSPKPARPAAADVSAVHP